MHQQAMSAAESRPLVRILQAKECLGEVVRSEDPESGMACRLFFFPLGNGSL